MNSANVRHNKMLFAILFAALSLDLAGRMINSNVMMSSDLASTSEQECATLIRDGITSSGRAGCVITFADGTRAEGEVRKVKKSARNDDWSAKKPDTQPPLRLPEVERPQLADCTDRKTFPTAAKRAACNKDNAGLEDGYKKQVAKRQGHLDSDAERIRTAKQAHDDLEDEFLIDVKSVGRDCDECRADGSFAMSKSESPQSIAQKMLAEAKKQQAMLAESGKKRKTELAAKEKFDKEVADCIRGTDGKGFSALEKLNCQVTNLSDAKDRKEANLRFGSIRSTLNQMLQSGSQEDRAQALIMADQIAGDTGLPGDIRDTARVLRVAGRYQSQMMSLSEAMLKAPQGSAAQMFHMNRLNALQNQMQYELGNAMISFGQRASMNLGSAVAYDELSNWFGLLNSSFQTAMMPSNFGQMNQFGQQRSLVNGTGNLAIDNQALLQQQSMGQLGVGQNAMIAQQYGPGTLVNRNLQTPFLNTSLIPGANQGRTYGPGTQINTAHQQYINPIYQQQRIGQPVIIQQRQGTVYQ